MKSSGVLWIQPQTKLWSMQEQGQVPACNSLKNSHTYPRIAQQLQSQRCSCFKEQQTGSVFGAPVLQSATCISPPLSKFYCCGKNRHCFPFPKLFSFVLKAHLKQVIPPPSFKSVAPPEQTWPCAIKGKHNLLFPPQ